MKKIMFLVLFMFLFTAVSGCTNNGKNGDISEIKTDSDYVTDEKLLDDMFTSRDLNQSPDLDDAISYTVSDNKDITITEEGTYIIKGKATGVTIYVETDKESKVQIVLDGVSIINKNFPCIYVKQADKVFVTTTDSENTLEVVDAFVDDGEINTNGVIFSKDDITLNGVGTLTINSTKNGIVGKDDLKITGGTYNITASKKAIDANDSIRILDGTFVLTSGTDGLHAENNDNDSLGYIYIGGGNFRIEAGDDGIRGSSVIQIDDGNIVINGSDEGIEGTYIQINGGNIDITAVDDGINAARKSDSHEVAVKVNGGYTKIRLGAGDTDGIDTNGNLYVYGGTLDIVARIPIDYDEGSVIFEGGKLIIGGEEYTYFPNQILRDRRKG